MTAPTNIPHVAIACGGTGGHLFPGIAVGREVLERGGRVTLFISEKEVDRQAVRDVGGMEIIPLPSVGLTRGRLVGFLAGLWRSRRIAAEHLRKHPAQLVLAMGGFTSAAPIMAGRRAGAVCFLHDSNVIPGRANRLLARFAGEIFLGFDAAQNRIRGRVRVTGTPVRPEFREMSPAAARSELGLRPDDPVLLIMGGSQGASGINRLLTGALPGLVGKFPRLQFIHLTGTGDLAVVQGAYTQLGVPALVQVFCSRMHLALGAATLAVSRAGGSTLAELAAMRTPSVLIPFPSAADNHQQLNAEVFIRQEAAALVAQNAISAAGFEALLAALLNAPQQLQSMRERLRLLQSPAAAGRIVDAMLEVARIELGFRRTDSAPANRLPVMERRRMPA